MTDETNDPKPAAQRATISDRRAQRQGAKPTKQQVRASQARVAKTAEAQAKAAASPEQSGTGVDVTSLSPAARRALERGAGSRGSGLPQGIVSLTREQEMGLIRGDLRRLMMIATSLLVAMLALLFVID
jgi:hypothetical protein